MFKNFAYIKYVLKSFFISDFKSNEIANILNDLEPEKFSREYLKSLRLDEKHEAELRIKLRVIIDKAYESKVPLGLEKGQFASIEEAYLFRQQYIAQYSQTNSILSILNKYTLLLIIASIAVILILIGA